MKYVQKVPRRVVFLAYLKTTNGMNNLSEKEMFVLSELMWFHKQFLERDAYSIPGVDIFATDTRKEIAKNLKISLANFNNLIGAIKKKGLIHEVGRTGLELHKKLDAFVKDVIKSGKAIVTFEMIMTDEPLQKRETPKVPQPGSIPQGIAEHGEPGSKAGEDVPQVQGGDNNSNGAESVHNQENINNQNLEENGKESHMDIQHLDQGGGKAGIPGEVQNQEHQTGESGKGSAPTLQLG